MRVCLRVFLCVCVYASHVSEAVCMLVCLRVFLCVCVYASHVCVCVCVCARARQSYHSLALAECILMCFICAVLMRFRA